LRKIVNTEGGADVSPIDRNNAATAASPKEVVMKTRTIILTIAAAAIVATPAAVLAQSPGTGFGPHSGHERGFDEGFGPGPGLGGFEHMLPRLTERLDLSDAQVAAIKGIIEARRPVIEGYAEQLREEREAYRAANPDPTTFDASSFRAHAEKQAQIQVELMVAVQGARAEILSQLSADQLTQLEEMRGARKHSMRRPGGRHHG
jgi:Spy/CpxP family protein refolding chaperone